MALKSKENLWKLQKLAEIIQTVGTIFGIPPFMVSYAFSMMRQLPDKAAKAYDAVEKIIKK